MARRLLSLVVVVLIAISFLIPFSYMPIDTVHAATGINRLSVLLNPGKGHVGDTVYVSATGVNSSAAVGSICTISANAVGLVTSSSASVVSSGTAAGSFIVVGTFPTAFPAASNASSPASEWGMKAATYNVTLTCEGFNVGFAYFQLLPRITLSPIIGTAGQVVTISGTGFRADATSCYLLSNSTTEANDLNVMTSPTCTLSGNGGMSGQFIVRSGAPNAAYNISVRPDRISNVSAFAYFRKVAAATISVSPGGAPPGFGTLDGGIAVAGGGFPTGSSRSCTLSSSGGSILFASSPARSCSIDTGGTVTGAFAVSTSAPNMTFTVNVTDSSSPFTYAFTTFNVWRLPFLRFNVTSAAIGRAVNVTLYSPTVFSPLDTGPCTITATPTSPALFSIASCNVPGTAFPNYGAVPPPSGPYSNLTAFFRVATTNPATYTVTVTTLHGVTASASFSPGGGPTVTVSPTAALPSPTSGPPVFVSVAGFGFNPLDTSCRVGMTGNSSKVIEGTPSCAIVSGGVTGSFQVATVAPPGSYQVNVTGSPFNDVGFAVFEVAVRANLTVTITSFTTTQITKTSTTTQTTSTSISTSLTTTTIQTTGRSTESHAASTTTAILGQTTTTTMTTTSATTTSTVTTFTILSTFLTTVTSMLGQIVRPLESQQGNALGLLAVMIVLAPGILRRRAG